LSDPFRLDGKVALVTGANTGIGQAIAIGMARAGAEVIAAGRSAVTHTLDLIAAEGREARPLELALDDPAAAARKLPTLGPIDILVNNAGIPEGMGIKPFRESTPESWRPYIDVNLYGVLNCCHAVINGMVARRFGRIVTISSGAGMVGLALGVSPYAAGKGGGISFMRHLALENAGAGVTANTVALGLINNQRTPDATAHLAKGVPVGRLGEPEDVGALCVYLASNEASWMTGQSLQINGGSVTS
jgi:NAD(P)-dependent dehydrogenase (short-subunit alcohol dehydrogenase family)